MDFILNIIPQKGPNFVLKIPGQNSEHSAHYFLKADRIFVAPSNFP